MSSSTGSKKCCNKFKKPTGNPGDPKRDMILRCQWIQQQIHAELASIFMGVESSGDNGLSVDDEDDEEEEEEEELVAVLGDYTGGDFPKDIGGDEVLGVGAPTGRVVGLEVSILRVMGSYPTQWTSMYVLVNPNPYGMG
jgi:hypothetical protein